MPKYVGEFKFYVQSALPSVYGNELSYYDELAKVVAKINEIITSQNILNDDFNNLVALYNQLKDYVDNYFKNLDVQEEINKKLDDMVADGTFSKLLEPYLKDFQDTVDEINDKYDVLKTRVDNLIVTGSEVYPELTDVRVGFNNVTYDTAGNAVREQFKLINSSVDELTILPENFKLKTKSVYDQIDFIPNKTINQNATAGLTIYNYTTPEHSSTSKFGQLASEPIRVRYDNGVLILKNISWSENTDTLDAAIVWYFDINGNYLSRYAGKNPLKNRVPDTGYYAVFQNYTSIRNIQLNVAEEIEVEWLKSGDDMSGLYVTPDLLKFRSKNILNDIEFIPGRTILSTSATSLTIYNYTDDEHSASSTYGSMSVPVKIRFGNSARPIFSSDIWTWETANTDAVLVYYFAQNGTYLTRYAGNNPDITNVPDDAYYVIFHYYSNVDNTVSFKEIEVDWIKTDSGGENPDQYDIYNVGPNRDYKSLTGLFKELENDTHLKRIYVDAGVYDIFEEIGGAEFCASITSDMTWTEVSTFVPDNTEIIGIGTVHLNFLPEADQIGAIAKPLLSALNIQNNVTLENISIFAKNCRYVIHDESGGISANQRSIHKYKNVELYYLESELTAGIGGAAFGCGFDSGFKFSFENCKFSTARPVPACNMHNRGGTIYDGSTIDFTNCVFLEGSASLRFGNVNENQQETIVRINGCYFARNIVISDEYSNPNLVNVYRLIMNNNNVVLVQITSTNIYEPEIYNVIQTATP